MTHIKIENLNVKINNRHVLKDINLEFNTNERILILGESGCGKSTLLLTLMGLTQRFDNAQVTGDILIDGRSIIKMKLYEISKIMGMVFQDPESQFCSLYPKDEVAFGLENLSVETSQMDDIIHTSLETVNFPRDKYDNQINELSGGEQQRLALASIFAQGAEMFLLDEPTANLDPRGRRQVVTSSKKAAKSGKGLLVVEHNLEHWLPFLDRIIVMDSKGTILSDGHPRDVYENYGETLKEKGIWRPQSIRLYMALKNIGHNLSKVPCNSSEICDEHIPTDTLNLAFQDLKHNEVKKNTIDKAVLEIKDLSVEYEKNKPVFNNVNLKVAEGDFFALVGCNGSGKSTLAKVLIKMIEPTYGDIILDGKNILGTKYKEIFDTIGYVFQNPEHQFVEDSVWSELSYSIDQLDIEEIEKKKYIQSLLQAFDLQDFIRNNPFSLSGGQKRRLSVATMLVGNKKLLILDEPTFGQDEKNTYKLMNKLCELNQEGITIFMITHDLDLVEEYANKTAVMHNGSIIFSGETKDLWKHKRLIEKSRLELPFKIKVLSGREQSI